MISQKGIKVQREGNTLLVINNRRCRVQVRGCTLPGQVLSAANPKNWHPQASMVLPDGPAQISVVLEQEGPRGPQPDAVGPFAPGSEVITFNI